MNLSQLQVKQSNDSLGTNQDMIFNAAGSAMTTGQIYSGVVYVYTNDSVLIYTPFGGNENGYMVYIGNRWGNEQNPSNETTAEVIVTVFFGKKKLLIYKEKSTFVQRYIICLMNNEPYKSNIHGIQS